MFAESNINKLPKRRPWIRMKMAPEHFVMNSIIQNQKHLAKHLMV
jgi:hypothetical protein